MSRMEKKVSSIYKRAQGELEERTKSFFEEFDKADRAMLKKLEAKEITEKAYKKWRKDEMLTGKHWQDLKKVVADEMLNATKTANAYINGQLPQIYSLNYNALKDSVTGIKGYSFELVDASTVRNLAAKNKTLLPYKKVDGKRFVRWNTQKVNAEIMQGIIQGESIPNIAKRLKNVTEMNEASAIRNARTSTTSAENKGRLDSYRDAEEKGLILKKVWLAEIDLRTRSVHRDELNGKEADVDEPFHSSLGDIMYPGDPSADPANVYNCRCTMKTIVKGFKPNAKN